LRIRPTSSRTATTPPAGTAGTQEGGRIDTERCGGYLTLAEGSHERPGVYPFCDGCRPP
jgi:hypothetical protein